MDQKMKSGINLKNLDEFSPDVIQQDDIKVIPRWFWGLYRLQYFSSYVRVYRLSAEDDLCPSITDRCIFILFMWRSPSLPLIAAAAETESRVKLNTFQIVGGKHTFSY